MTDYSDRPWHDDVKAKGVNPNAIGQIVDALDVLADPDVGVEESKGRGAQLLEGVVYQILATEPDAKFRTMIDAILEHSVRTVTDGGNAPIVIDAEQIIGLCQAAIATGLTHCVVACAARENEIQTEIFEEWEDDD